jgi:cell division protein FtsI/penicillin-binding protein 2
MMLDTENARTSLNSAEKNGKMLVLAFIIIAVFVIYILKLFSMQVVEGEKYRSQSQNMSSKLKKEKKKK